jgi:hypothetical protein
MADTWDEEDNEQNQVLEWAAAERIATTDHVVARLSADIDVEFAAKDAARESAREHVSNRGRILFKAKHQLKVRGQKI